MVLSSTCGHIWSILSQSIFFNDSLLFFIFSSRHLSLDRKISPFFLSQQDGHNPSCPYWKKDPQFPQIPCRNGVKFSFSPSFLCRIFILSSFFKNLNFSPHAWQISLSSFPIPQCSQRDSFFWKLPQITQCRYFSLPGECPYLSQELNGLLPKFSKLFISVLHRIKPQFQGEDLWLVFLL